MAEWRASAARGPRAGAAIALLGALLCALLLSRSPSSAQQPDAQPRIEYSRWRDFNIPFNAGDARIVKVHLYSSEDKGHTWTYRATAEPARGHKWFEFKAERDGWFWFSVQVEDSAHQLYPPKVEAGSPPTLEVCVDIEKPRLTIQSVAAPAGQAGVSWNVQDENLNNLRQGKAGTLLLDYRPAGRDLPWTAVPADQKAVGQAFWNVSGGAPLEVRLRVADDAGNLGEASATITPGVAGAAISGGGDGGPRPATTPTATRSRQFTNSKRVNLKYGLQDVGKSGVSVVEVWNTMDGRSWQMLKAWKEIPKDQLDKPLAIPLTFDREGLYGFTLVPRSGVGRGAPGPQSGDDAQIWIEYDATPPVVHLTTADVGRGDDDGKLLISWTAEDKNIDRSDRCVTLSYAEDPKGPWTPFAKDLPNDGFYSWKMDSLVPFQLYVRVEARDKAGNVGKAETPEAVKVDLKQPRANVNGIEPLGSSQ
jgi:hypothetical protein